MAQKTETIDGLTSTGQAAPSELDSLAGLAATVDGEHLGALPDGTAIADQPAPVDYASEAAMTVDTIAALAPVYEKYGFTMGGMPCELVLIITAGPLLYQSSKLIATQMAQEKAAKQAKPKAVDAATGNRTAAPTESPEVLRHPQTALYPA